MKHLDNVVVCCFAVLGVVGEEYTKWHDNIFHSKPENKGRAQSLSVLASVLILLNPDAQEGTVGNVAQDRGV